MGHDASKLVAFGDKDGLEGYLSVLPFVPILRDGTYYVHELIIQRGILQPEIVRVIHEEDITLEGCAVEFSKAVDQGVPVPAPSRSEIVLKSELFAKDVKDRRGIRHCPGIDAPDAEC